MARSVFPGVLLLALALGGPARAADTWTNVAPGIDRLKRVIVGSPDHVIHAVKVNLDNPDYYVRTTRTNERGKTGSGFASHLGQRALVVINGDWGTASAPWNVQGLAMGSGFRWKDDKAHWSFVACTLDTNRCDVDFSGAAASAVMDPRWWSAVGSNGSTLIKRGVKRYGGSFDGSQTARHPRSAIGFSQDGRTMWLVVVEGRRSQASGSAAPYADGATFDNMVDIMADLGCYDAVMQDGGGSSTLVVNGTRVNRLPVGQTTERTVANHLAIMKVRVSPDPGCATLSKGRYCVGSVLNTCEGGTHSSGDCGAFGLGCRQDGTWAYCLDARCPPETGGSCNGTRIVNCKEGVYEEKDCASTGSGCAVVNGLAVCVDARCNGTPDSTACAGNLVKRCVAGAYSEQDCGAPCRVEGGTASCGDARCAGKPEGPSCQDYFLQTCTNGTFTQEDCSDLGGTCAGEPGAAYCDLGTAEQDAGMPPEPSDAGSGEPPPGEGDGGTGVVDAGPGSVPAPPGLEVAVGSCAAAGGHVLAWPVLLLGLLARRRRTL
ncbi:MAG: hypothetical protein RL653_3210 [Pseudomonadota bacterium]